jgi:Zn-dependent M28 family amino/carboxypeptidase
MLASLYQGLKDETREHTFIFIAFAGEAQGLVGSRFYVKSLAAEELAKIKAMICMDTLALGPTEVWVNRSNPELALAASKIVQSLKLPLYRSDVEKIGESDEEAFIQHKIPTITIHSLTQETLSVQHSPKDNYTAVHFEDYYQSYRLLSAYLAYLDKQEAPSPKPAGSK